MHTDTRRLDDLVKALDKMGSKPALIDLATALEQAQLTLADVQPFVQPNPQNYNRATVKLGDQYELLVMTWLSGQSSVPHDHGGSICAMLTVRGQAVEGNYSVAPDGYVDLEYENIYPAGEVTAGEDAAVHTISNAADEILVTVHIYSPPLRDFRRFTARPAVTEHAPAPDDSETMTVVGGGFSGSITAAQLLRQARSSSLPLRVVLLEQRGSIGEGLAYSSREECHLLNVPAGRMSAWPDQPNDFLRWANARNPAISADDFLPRQWYGEYIRQTLLKAAADAGHTIQLSVIFDEVRRIARHPGGGWMLNLARGTSVRASAVVLAIGHRSPNDPLGNKWTGSRTRFITDPWRTFAMNAVGPDDAVIILGSGLTAVDAVMSLVNRGHRGTISLISRRGLLPQPHLNGHAAPVDLNTMVMGLTADGETVQALDLLRQLRRQTGIALSQGKPWQSVIDGLRPHIAMLWSRMPIPQRRRFLCHLRSLWEVHRHRMPVPVAKRFSELLGAGQVRILRGRVESVVAEGNLQNVTVRNRTNGIKTQLACGWIVNATGPSPSNSAAANPAIGSLLIQGLLTVDELRLGVRTTPDGNAMGSDGQAVNDLFVVGTLRKPDLWESTAVPELRTQAASTAAKLLSSIVPPSIQSPSEMGHAK
jgi:uncharacterized NAD(P)/FAD-binding protein YdhS/predicted metal-dependent enzyme (double-stranded beta helix superfamily)